jgi:phosphate transport system substrate-binding protein
MIVSKPRPAAALLSTLALLAIGFTGCTTTTSTTTSSPAASGSSASSSSASSPAASTASSSSSAEVKVDGSSTVYPISEAVAEEFQNSRQGKVKVAIGTSGTGGGFKKFCRGETDISNASRPILEKEIADCKAQGIEYIELPIAYDALTVVVNPANTWAGTLKLADLKKMWEPAAQGKVMTWKDVNPSFPGTPLKLFGAGSSSGTFDYFTEAINGKAKASRGDFTASEDDNVLVSGVSGDKNALGYFGYSYYDANKAKLKAVAIDNGKGGVLPSAATVKDGTYTPLSRPLFIYVSAKSMDKPDVKAFVDYYLANVAKVSAEVKYIPLTDAIYAKVQERAKAKKLGTIFGGKEAVGLKIEDMLAKESK